MNRKGKEIGKRMMSWVLTLVMVLSLVMVPAGTAQAETVTVTGTDVITATDTGVYVSYTSELEFAANVWGTGSPAVDLYKYAFTLHNNTDTTISDWSVRIIPNSNAYWNSGWNGASYDSSTGAVVLGTYKGTGDDGSTWSTAEVASGATVTGMGAQCRANIFDGATIELTYSVGNSTQAPSVDDTATDPSTIGSTSDKVTATVKQASQSYDYYQYEIAVNNGLSETIGDWIVVIPVTGITSSNAWDGDWAKVKWSYDSSYIYVTSNCGETISAGSSVSGESYKIQYSGSAALSTGEAKVYYKTGTSSTGAFNSVISAGSQPSGGGSGSGDSGSGGGTFDGDNIGSIDTSLDYNFAKLLQYSLYFYDANMCGDQVSETSLYSKDLYNGWRGDCHVNDKFTYNGKSYSAVGGFHDAGDHVKFGVPLAVSMTTLGLGYYEFGDAYDDLGQTSHLKTITDYYCDYVKNCTVLNSSGEVEAFCYQVGSGQKDHESWCAPEVENETATNRTYTLVATSSNPATDVVSETAAALAINYLNFGNKEDLQYAKALFAFAMKYTGSIGATDASGSFYGSSSWKDDFCLAAGLLYKATGDSTYVTAYNNNNGNSGNLQKPYGWDNVYHAAVLYAPTANSSELNTMNNYFNSVASGSASSYFCADKWGSARINCNVQLMMMIYDKHNNTNTFQNWAKYQMSMILGNNSIKKNLVCGYNTNSPTKPHHRAASGYSGWTEFNNNATQKYTLYGALVGGPTTSDFSTYKDAVNDAVTNEVTTDYNAGMVGASAALYLAYKNSTEEGFTNQTINADFYGGSNFTPAGGTTVAVESVTLDVTSATLTVGDTQTLTATISPEDATNKTIAWSSTDTSVATVSNGTVKAIKAGTTTITAKAGGKSATCTVTVKNPPVANLTASVSSLTCNSLEYGYNTASTASVLVSNVGDAATTSLKATLEQGTYYRITDGVASSLAVGANDTITVAPVTGLQAGTYADNLIVTYNTNKTIKVPVSVTVNKRSITVKANNMSKTYGENNPDLTGQYTISSGSLVSGDSLAVTLTTNATSTSPVDDYDIVVKVGSLSNYNVTTQNGTLTVTPKPITDITFPIASDIEVGEKLESSELSGGDTTFGTYVWKDATQELSRGTHNVDVVLKLSNFALTNYSFTGVAGYNATAGTITKSISVNVLRAGLPVVTFPTATALQYGQQLSDSDLVGGSTEYGTFKWKNDSVTMTAADVNNGMYSAEVVFEWSDEIKEEKGILDTDEDATMTKTVTVKVTKADRLDSPAAAVLSLRTANSIKVQSVDGVQFSLDKKNWQDSAEFTGLSSFTSYKVYTRYKETATHKAGSANLAPLQVYTLVANPYTIDVGKVTNANYIDALRTVDNGVESATTATYENGVLTLTTTDKTYTITGSNSKVTVQVPYGNVNVILSNTMIRKLDVSNAALAVIRVNGTSTVESIVSNSGNEVEIIGNGTLNAAQIKTNGSLVLSGPTVVVDATGVDGAAISASNVTIGAGEVTAIGGNGGAGIASTDSITITGGDVIVTGGAGASGMDAAGTMNITGGTVAATGGDGSAAITGNIIKIENSSVTATGGSGASAIETTGENGSLTIKDASVEVNIDEDSDESPIASDNITLVGDNAVSSSTGTDNIYSSTPKDEYGNVIASYTVNFLDADGKTELDSVTVYAGGKITLPEIEEEDGYTVTWKNKSNSKTYKPNASFTVTGDVTFVVYKKKILVTKITLDSTAETIEVGDGVALAETVVPENAFDTSVAWSSSNTAVATVTQDGEVEGVAPGTATITVKAKDGSGKSATCKITVVEGEPEEVAVEKIKITGATKKVAPGKKLKLTATVYPSNATNQKVKWKVSNKKYATVNSKGVVTTKKSAKGKKVTVTAYSVEDDSIKGTYKISIMKNPVKKIKLSAKTKTIKKGKSVTIKARFTPSKGISKELTWTSSNKKVATVNSKGKVTGKKKGTVKITAKAKDGSGKKATIKIKVK